jgi:uncharacterized protein (DUF1684 family)
MRKKIWLGGSILLILTGAFYTAYAQENPQKVNPEEKWKQILLQDRQAKDYQYKTSSTSPMAGIIRYTQNPGENVYFIEKKEEFFIEKTKEKGASMSLFQKNGDWIWENLSKKVTGIAGGKPFKSGSTLPAQSVFNVGRFTVLVLSSPEKNIIIVHDPERPQIKKFTGLKYFPPDLKYYVDATITKFEKVEEVKMLTSRNLEKTFFRYARINFKLDGKSFKLTAYKYSLDQNVPGFKILFIFFNDTTNGEETYGGGRYLEVVEPLGKGFKLDFNRCYNPLCNYADTFNCPIPPDENDLNVPIKAGEKAYPIDLLKH